MFAGGPGKLAAQKAIVRDGSIHAPLIEITHREMSAFAKIAGLPYHYIVSRISIAVVEAEPTFRYGVCTYLEQNVADAMLVAQAASLDELHMDPSAALAEILIVSWEFTAPDEEAALRALVERASPPAAVIAICAESNIASIVAAFDLGVAAIILRNGEPEEIGRSIREIVNGRRYVCAAIGVAVLKRISEIVRDAPTPDGAGKGRLTRREEEMLAYFAKGFASKEIAQALSLSVRTVENHRTNIMAKLGIHSTIGLVRYAAALELKRAAS